MPLCLLEGEQFANSLDVGTFYQSCVVEVALALLRLFGQDVAVVGMLSFDFACSSKGETLLAGGIGLNLWHCCEENLVVCNSPRHWVPTVSVNFILV